MSRKLWTPEELDFLTKNYPSLGATKCAEHLDRSVKSVNVKASRLGLKVVSNRNWTEEEIDFLIKNIPVSASLAEISKELGRSTQAIEQKARSLGLKCIRFFSEEEDRYIIENYPEGDVLEIAETLNRPYNAIPKRAHRLKIKRNKLINKKSLGYLYIIKFTEYSEVNLFKVGITNNPNRRFSEFGTKVEVLSLLHGTYEEVHKLEQYLLNFIEPYKQNYFILKSGNTETYSC